MALYDSGVVWSNPSTNAALGAAGEKCVLVTVVRTKTILVPAAVAAAAKYLC